MERRFTQTTLIIIIIIIMKVEWRHICVIWREWEWRKGWLFWYNDDIIGNQGS